MILKYNIDMDNQVINKRIQNLINQTYKLLPNREEGVDWIKPLQTIIEQLVGMYRLMDCGYPDVYLPLLNKLGGLYSLDKEDDFACYRRTIFECLGLMSTLQREICLQS